MISTWPWKYRVQPCRKQRYLPSGATFPVKLAFKWSEHVMDSCCQPHQRLLCPQTALGDREAIIGFPVLLLTHRQDSVYYREPGNCVVAELHFSSLGWRKYSRFMGKTSLIAVTVPLIKVEQTAETDRLGCLPEPTSMPSAREQDARTHNFWDSSHRVRPTNSRFSRKTVKEFSRFACPSYQDTWTQWCLGFAFAPPQGYHFP